MRISAKLHQSAGDYPGFSQEPSSSGPGFTNLHFPVMWHFFRSCGKHLWLFGGGARCCRLSTQRETCSGYTGRSWRSGILTWPLDSIPHPIDQPRSGREFQLVPERTHFLKMPV